MIAGALWTIAALAADPDTVSDADAAEKTLAARGGGSARTILALGSVGTFAACTVWFFEGGTRLGAGDPASVAMGASFIGLTGALAGGLSRALSETEAGFDDRVSAPWVSLDASTFGTATFSERRPPTAALTIAPRFYPHPRVRIVPSARLSQRLGSRRDVDPRPQGEIEPALSATRSGVDLSLDARLFLGDSDGPIASPGSLDLIARPMLAVRWETITSLALDETRMLQRTALVPLSLGLRVHLSHRQRFEWITGPTINQLAWSTEDGERDSAQAYLGELWSVASYDIHIPYTSTFLGHTATSRFRIVYSSLQFDGLGIDSGAVIGYIGPLTLSFDTEWRKGSRWALFSGLSATLASGGSAALTVGVVPPTQEPAP